MRAGLRRSTQLAGLARAVVRARTERASPDAQHNVVLRLLKLHGLPQKIGQVLSLGELDREEQTYSQLTEAAPALPIEKVKRIVEEELGRGLRQCFREFAARGISASLGQVHRATLYDGREVAVKIQYPGIGKAVEADLRALGWLMAPVGGLRRGFDVSGYRAEIAAMLNRELDYRREAGEVKRFRKLAEGLAGVEVPELIEKFSTSRVLVTTWMRGGSFAVTKKWTPEAQAETARILLNLFLKSIFEWGVIHADPHPGNIRFSLREGDPRVGLLDFGAVAEIPPGMAARLGRLIQDVQSGGLRNRPELALQRYESLGFQRELLEPMAPLLPALSEVLFEPFCASGEYSVRDWRVGERISAIAGDLRWNFRMAGPPAMIFLMRTLHGLMQYLSALQQKVDWRAAYENCVRSHEAMRAATSVEKKPAGTGEIFAIAKHLRVQVMEGERQKVSVTFMAHRAQALPELLPPEVLEKVAERQIDLNAIAERAVQTQFAPAELFRLEEGAKLIRVSLE
jgi:predicted unusual protein kinase regulating ubiquinone biosynthesis (AarF/ABC1/UbiB family)